MNKKYPTNKKDIEEEQKRVAKENLSKHEVGKMYKDKEGLDYYVTSSGLIMRDYGNGFD